MPLRTTTATNVEHLALMYTKPGPFVTWFGRVGGVESDRAERFADLRREAVVGGASDRALEAIEARLTLPVFGHVGGQAVIAAADGSTAVDIAHEGPAEDVAFVDSLPYAAPLIEWQQWRVPHVVVIGDAAGYEEVSFIPGSESARRPIGATATEAAHELMRTARDEDVELILLSGDDVAIERVSAKLVGNLPLHTKIVRVDDTIDDLASAVVREVADVVARRTVALLQEFRFLQEHDGAVEGADATLGVLHRGMGDVLLVHDDPLDERRAWFGRGATDVSTVATPICDSEGRLVDVLIRSGILQGLQVRVIPTTGPRGPAENVAVLLRDPLQSAPETLTAP